MRREMSVGCDLLASQALAFAGFGNHVAERRSRLGAVSFGFRSLNFRFLVGHLRSISPRQSYSRTRPDPSGSIRVSLLFYIGLKASGCVRRRGERAVVKCELFPLASDDNRRGLQRIVETFQIAIICNQDHARARGPDLAQARF